MLKKIAVTIISPKHDKRSFNFGIELAKKFNCELSVIECVYKTPPKFYFFETKSDKEASKIELKKLKEELDEWKQLAQKQGLKITTKLAWTETVAHWVIDYVKEHHIELIVVDYPKLSMVEANMYDDIINTIHHKAHCHVLTMKS